MSAPASAADWIARLGLTRHPEGGWYRETYRSAERVPAGVWYGARVAVAGGWALLGGTVAPGFEFADFELAGRAALLAQWPRHRALIEALT